MQKYVHEMEEFPEFFSKLHYWMEKYWAIYSALLFKVKDKTRLNEFREFLLKYLRITDTVFSFSENKVLVILEEATIRWTLLLTENLSEKIKEKWFAYDYYCSAVQWDFIDSEDKLYKALKKRLKIAKEGNIKECVYSLET